MHMRKKLFLVILSTFLLSHTTFNTIEAETVNLTIIPNEPKPPIKIVPYNPKSNLILRGDRTCRWGASDCNACVENVPLQFARLKTDYREAGRIRFDGYAYPTKDSLLNRIQRGDFYSSVVQRNFEHVQGIGRIAGVGNNEYMVFTHSTASEKENKQGALAVVRMGANNFSRGGTLAGPESGMENGDDSDQTKGNRTVARTFSGNNHPGGLSVLGHYVYVAQWCQEFDGVQMNDWCHESSAAQHGMGFSVYDVSNVNQNAVINSAPPIHKYYRHVYNESWIRTSSTASIAAVKLENGTYLVALGRSGGKAYGFYSGPTPTGPFTYHNEVDFKYFGENATIVTDRNSGDLYLFQIEAFDNSKDKVHLYYLSQKQGKINAEHIYSRQFTCRGDGGDWCDFDAGGSIYVTSQGNLILYATDWHQSDAGNIRLTEFSEDAEENWSEY